MLTMKRVIAAGAVLLFAAAAAQAQTTTDEAAAVLIYPKIVFNTETPTDTLIEIANTDDDNPARLICFYVNATSHCTNTGLPGVSTMAAMRMESGTAEAAPMPRYEPANSATLIFIPSASKVSILGSMGLPSADCTWPFQRSRLLSNVPPPGN